MYLAQRTTRLSTVVLAAIFGLSNTAQVPLGQEEYLSAAPLLGFGTWNLKVDLKNTTDAVSAAIQIGYRHIDCAAIYGNEKAVGAGIRDGINEAGIARSDIWVTSKLWNTAHDPAQVPNALERTLHDLGIEYLDLYLMHWPVASKNGKQIISYLDTWDAMTRLPNSRTRNIGISNFSPHQLKDLMSQSSVKPFAHQFETHPYLQQKDWVRFHKDNNIHVTAYSPLGNLNPLYTGNVNQGHRTILNDPDITTIAESRNCTNVQTVLAWGMTRGTSVIPKSSHVDHIKENAASVDCVLEDEDLVRVDGIRERYVRRFNDPSKSWGVDLYEGLEGK